MWKTCWPWHSSGGSPSILDKFADYVHQRWNAGRIGTTIPFRENVTLSYRLSGQLRHNAQLPTAFSQVRAAPKINAGNVRLSAGHPHGPGIVESR